MGTYFCRSRKKPQKSQELEPAKIYCHTVGDVCAQCMNMFVSTQHAIPTAAICQLLNITLACSRLQDSWETRLRSSGGKLELIAWNRLWAHRNFYWNIGVLLLCGWCLSKPESDSWQERHKTKGLLSKTMTAHGIHIFVHFFAVLCITTTWNDQIQSFL